MSRSAQDPRLSILSEMFPFRPTRGERRIVAIVEGALESYGRYGIEKTTYETIATACKVSRPLIQHYFKTKEEIFELVVKYIRISFQQHVVEGMKKSKTPQQHIEVYVRIVFSWIEKYPKHARVWLLFYFNCAVDKKWRALNTELVQFGRVRICAMIEAGNKARVFHCENVPNTAMTIQTLITGGMLVSGTEDLPVPTKQFVQSIVDECLRLARGA